jgi:hypothetical protein
MVDLRVSHIDEYKEYCLLECDTILCSRNSPTFRGMYCLYVQDLDVDVRKNK